MENEIEIARPVEPTKENLEEPLPVDSSVKLTEMAKNLLPVKEPAKSRTGITKKVYDFAKVKKARKLAKKNRQKNRRRNSNRRA